jgi:hypothetical protein
MRPIAGKAATAVEDYPDLYPSLSAMRTGVEHAVPEALHDFLADLFLLLE